MTDRLTASTITDAQLDELYARAEQAEAMLGRVAVLGSDLFTGAPGPERDIGRKILTVLSLPRTGPDCSRTTPNNPEQPDKEQQ